MQVAQGSFAGKSADGVSWEPRQGRIQSVNVTLRCMTNSIIVVQYVVRGRMHKNENVVCLVSRREGCIGYQVPHKICYYRMQVPLEFYKKGRSHK